MTELSISLVLLSALLHSLWNYFTKASRSPIIFIFWKVLFTSLLAVALFTIRIPSGIPPFVWGCIIASGLIHFFYWFSLSRAYTSGDISYVYPIARSASGFLPLFAFIFLKEVPSLRGISGIFLILFSIYLLQYREGARDFRKIISFLKKKDAVWSFATLVTIVGYSLVDKAGMSSFKMTSRWHPARQAATFYLAATSLSFLLYGISVLVRFPFRALADVGKKEWRKIIIAGSLTFLSYGLILYVMMTEEVSYIVSLRQCSVIFTVFLGAVLLKEAYGWLRFIASVIIVIGMFLIATA